jgi:hypothetical protein
MPALQEGVVWGRLHALPQVPQLFGSPVVLTSQPVEAILSQSAFPSVHTAMAQLDPLQKDVAWARLHWLPQPPQLLWSFVKFTHCWPASAAPAQTVGVPPGHAQAPPWQTAPLGQWWPQLPQLLRSVDKSAQTPEHILSVLRHKMHALIEHRYPAWQAFPQPPQLPWSVAVSTHALPHDVDCALGHLQAPPTQLAPLGHATPQLPQWLGSLCVSTHCPALPHRVPGQS